MPIIESRDLARSYRAKQGSVDAVRGLTFSVGEGEIVGLLGPNGAGKTTTMRMLATLLKPTAGSANVVGCDLREDPQGVRRQIGYIGQSSATTPLVSVREELVFQGRLYRLSAIEAERRADELLDLMSLRDLRDRPTITLSGGQQRRLDITLGLVHQPRLLLLDEPSSGLDPQVRSQLWEHLKSLREKFGTTLLLSTHYLDEADALCDRVLIVNEGRMVAEDSPRRLKQKLGRDVLEVELQDGIEKGQTVLRDDPRLHDVTVSAHTLRIVSEHGAHMLVEVLRTLEDAGLQPVSARLLEPTLDDVFLTYMAPQRQPAA